MEYVSLSGVLRLIDLYTPSIIYPRIITVARGRWCTMFTMTLGLTHSLTHTDALAQTCARTHIHSSSRVNLAWTWWMIINRPAIIVPKSLCSSPTLRTSASPSWGRRNPSVCKSLYGCTLKRTFIICYNIAHSSPNDIIKHNSIRTSSSCVLLFLIYPPFYFKFLSSAGLKLLHCHSVGGWGAARPPTQTTAKTKKEKKKDKWDGWG